MSWHDPMNVEEPEEDRALRAELRGMLGVPADAGPQDLMVAPPLRLRGLPRAAAAWPSAAALVAIAATAATAAWGIGQKHRADALAARAVELESRQTRLEEALGALAHPQPDAVQGPDKGADGGKGAGEAPPALRASGKEGKDAGRGELVRPEEGPTRLDSSKERHLVKDRR